MPETAPVVDRRRPAGPTLAARADGGAPATAALLRHLGRLAALTSEDEARVAVLAASRRRCRPGTVLAGPGSAPGPHFVLSGWACSQRVLRDGRRQILDFVLPGEGFGFGPLPEDHAHQSVVALTALEMVAASGLADGAPMAPAGGLWQALRGMRLEIGARRLDHLVRLGKLTAYERAAHFILEMQQRVGLGDARSFPLPLTQEVMADALGLSVVHLNRVLRQLRAAGLADIRGGVAVVHNRPALAAAAILSVAQPPPAAGH